MGHSTTEMLFRVYARYVPNLTRNDGSAMERLLNSSVEVNHDPLPITDHLNKALENPSEADDEFWKQFIDEEGDDLGGAA